MIWLKSNWHWATFNLFALCVSVYILSQGRTGWENMDTFDSGLESGKWAIRFLLTCLTMTPLNTYCGWKGAIKLRKSAGLWACGFASLHVLFYIREAKFQWLTMSMPFFLVLGLTGMTILAVLACTSNRRAMRWLGKNWKRLHRLVYGSGIAVVTHSILATTISKKIMVRDPEAPHELKIYIACLAVLLVVRVPIVREFLKQFPVLLKRSDRSHVVVAAPPDRGAELLPKIYGRESSVSVKPTFIISNHPPSKSKNRLAENSGDSPSTEDQFEEEVEVQ